MTSTNWKEIVHEGIVKFMPENARFDNGVPNKASITRAGIKADESGEYNEPRVFTNEEIQRQVGLLHKGGTPIACVRWYRNNPGPRKTTARAGFKEAYAYFKEQGNNISQEDLAKIAETNLHIIFGARGADLTVLSEYKIMENFKKAMAEIHKKTMEDKLTKARAARTSNPEITDETPVEVDSKTVKKPIKKLKAKV